MLKARNFLLGQMKLKVSRSEYGLLVVGNSCRVSFQGTRYAKAPTIRGWELSLCGCIVQRGKFRHYSLGKAFSFLLLTICIQQGGG